MSIDDMRKDSPDDTLQNWVCIPTATALSEIRLGHGDRAVELLRAARLYERGPASLYAIYVRGLAYLQMKSGRDAAAEFQKIIDHRGLAAFVTPLYPLSHLGLARA